MKERDFWSILEWKDSDIELVDNTIIKKKMITEMKVPKLHKYIIINFMPKYFTI